MVSTDQNNAGATLGSLGIGGPPSGSTTKTKYLGIPKGYTPPSRPGGPGEGPGGMADPGNTFGSATNPGNYSIMGSTPGPSLNGSGYTEADKWGPAADLGSIQTIQADLIAAGLLKLSDVRPGVWDAASADAYGQVLSYANQQGLTASDALTILTSNPPLVKPKTGPGPRVIAFTNPQDVATQYQNVSQQLTGQEQDPAQFQQVYHGLEAAQAGTNGTNYTQAPSLTGAATQYIQQNMPGQELAYGAASREQEFLHMVGQ